MVLQFFEKGFRFPETCFKVKALKTFKIFSVCHIKTCRSLKRTLEQPMLFPKAATRGVL